MIDKECIGSDFDDFLRNEGLIEHAEAVAAKRVIAFQISEEMKKASITKTELAHRMHTSRPVVDRLLDLLIGRLLFPPLPEQRQQWAGP